MVPARSSKRCCRNARSCFNCRSTRNCRSSDGPVRAKFHESSRLASTRLNSRARTDRVNSLRTERICDRVVLAPSAFDKSLSANKSSIRATSPAAYASWTSCQSEETVASPSARNRDAIDARAADRFPLPADQSFPVPFRSPGPLRPQNVEHLPVGHRIDRTCFPA